MKGPGVTVPLAAGLSRDGICARQNAVTARTAMHARETGVEVRGGPAVTEHGRGQPTTAETGCRPSTRLRLRRRRPDSASSPALGRRDHRHSRPFATGSRLRTPTARPATPPGPACPSDSALPGELRAGARAEERPTRATTRTGHAPRRRRPRAVRVRAGRLRRMPRDTTCVQPPQRSVGGQTRACQPVILRSSEETNSACRAWGTALPPQRAGAQESLSHRVSPKLGPGSAGHRGPQEVRTSRLAT